ncbi:MAG: transcription elongation factor GreB [Proteobacteria bacterium]|nr:transcription elongation factor GreB [Pseudomonadota bacterium]
MGTLGEKPVLCAFDRIAVFLATGFGIGYSKRAPGTLGSLVGLPFAYLLSASEWDLKSRLGVWLVAGVLGFLITARAEKAFSSHDDQRIVIDEIVGQLIAVSLFPPTMVNLLLGFALFRLFDIWKPGPIGHIDKKWPRAWGTFFDDILAGLAEGHAMTEFNDDAPGKPFENLMTPDGYRKIQDELNQLFNIERPKLVDEVSTAAAHGDRSENAEYIYGKKRLREIDKRMNFLKKRFDSAKVIDPSKQEGALIQFGAIVTIQDEAGLTKTWSVVGEDEVDPSAGKISWLSPIGRAMLGKSIGEYFQVTTPKGELEFSIVKFEYPT